jgi:DNA-binding transcriptional ArsR family regulator
MMNHLAEHSGRLDAVFHALSDPTRRAMIGHLAERECTIGELATPFRMSFAGASKHVRVLENAGLVTRMIKGRTHLCRLAAARLAEADSWLGRYEHFWTESLERLDAFLREQERSEAQEPKGKERGRRMTKKAAKPPVRPTSKIPAPPRLRHASASRSR